MKNKNCFQCDNEAKYNHHVVPKSRGGTETVPLCDTCHWKAHHIDSNVSISELTKKALQKLKKQGRRISRTPYGYDLAKDGIILIKNIQEQSIIKQILLLRNRGFSYQGIADILHEGGVPTKRGGEWHQATINGLVKQHGNKE